MSYSGSRKRIALTTAAIVVIAVAVGLAYMNPFQSETKVVKVFHAGSLTVPFEEVKARFEADHKNVVVELEPAGSVACVQKITETGKEADILASADYSLIPNMMMPDHADWYLIFAKNRMTLAYTENSLYADEVTPENWYEILRREGVKWGFSNPNLDPCGYRTPMVIQLAELEYSDDRIFEDLVAAHSAIMSVESEGIYIIDANKEDLQPDTEKITIRDKSVELVSLCQAGGLDYAFEYSSVAKQHGLLYLDLPGSIDLSDMAYAETYVRVRIEKTTGTSTGKPIVYGITIPKNAPNPELAEEFVKYVINDIGQGVFTENGQPPIAPAITNDIDLVPESLKPLVTETG
jgi:molybdate/tungstate transport system substrate-binding protein